MRLAILTLPLLVFHFIGCGGNVNDSSHALSAGGSPSTAHASPSTGGTPGIRELSPAQWAAITDQACAGSMAPMGDSPERITFVVDVSNSMGELANDGSGRTKWEITQETLQSSIDSLPSDYEIGLVLFPNQATSANPSRVALDIEACVSAAKSCFAQALGTNGSSQRNCIRTALSNAVPQGARPTHDAFALANGTEPPTTVPGRSQFVLVTDGPPTLSKYCTGPGDPSLPEDAQPVVDEVQYSYDVSQSRTSVVGLPGTEQPSFGGDDGQYWLSAAASQGGTPVSGGIYRHYDLSQSGNLSADFASTLRAVTDPYYSCHFPLPFPPSGATLKLETVGVAYLVGGSLDKPRLIPPAADCSGDGWIFDSSMNVVLCAQTCNLVKQDPQATIFVLANCAPYFTLE